MSVTLLQLAELVRGNVHGDSDIVIADARTLAEAQSGDITFIENEKNAGELRNSKAVAAVVPLNMTADGKSVIQVADPLMAFVTIVRHFHGRPEQPPMGIDPRPPFIPRPVIGPGPSIHPFAVIGEGAVVGARCRIHSGAVIGRFCHLGDDVTSYPGRRALRRHRPRPPRHRPCQRRARRRRLWLSLHEGRHVKVPQLGHVEIGDDVEIGACTTIDRGTFGPRASATAPRSTTWCMIGHNCQIGRHNLFVSQVGIAGSCTHRRLRGHGRPGRHRRPRPHRRPAPSSAPRRASPATCPPAAHFGAPGHAGTGAEEDSHEPWQSCRNCEKRHAEGKETTRNSG